MYMLSIKYFGNKVQIRRKNVERMCMSWPVSILV